MPTSTRVSAVGRPPSRKAAGNRVPRREGMCLSLFPDVTIRRCAMSLRPEPLCSVPEETARVAHGAFPQNHPSLPMGDLFDSLFQDEQFAALYPQRVQPAAAPWLLAHTQPEWTQRYARRFEESRLPQLLTEREALAQTIGTDGIGLLSALCAEEAPRYLREIPAVETLRQVWVQQFYREGEQVRWRTPKELPPAAVAISSPYDPDARYGKKRQTEWVGYKVHLTETCDADAPLLITDVQTAPSPSGDSEALPQFQAACKARELLPARQLVDGAYIKGTGL